MRQANNKLLSQSQPRATVRSIHSPEISVVEIFCPLQPPFYMTFLHIHVILVLD